MTNTFTMRGQTSITIRHRTYTFTGSSITSGGRANVMKMVDSNNNYYALKVFHQNHYQRYSIDTEKDRNTLIQTIPGLEWVNHRIMINAYDDANLIQQYPLIENAILMPWFDEQTWLSWGAVKLKIIAYSALPMPSQDILNTIAYQLADAVSQLHDLGLAHGDINDNNVLVDINTGKITIIDIEDMYMPGATYKEAAGTNGYRFNYSFSAWNPDADKFSTAILLSEIMSLPRTCAHGMAVYDGYFTQDEINNRDTNCIAFKTLTESLNTLSPSLHQLFYSTWHATDLSQCPQLYEWVDAIASLTSTGASTHSLPSSQPLNTPSPQPQSASSQQKVLKSWRDELEQKTYTPQVADSEHPALIFFVLDYSNSMKTEINENSQVITRADRMYHMVGTLLSFLQGKSTKHSMVSPRYHIGIMAYGKTCLNVLKHIDKPAVAKSLPQKIMPARHAGIWQLPTLLDTIGGAHNVDPEDSITAYFKSLYPMISQQINTNDTYMTEVFTQIYDILTNEELMRQYGGCAAPLIIHITDGFNTDPRDVVPITHKLRDLNTKKGGNLLISTTYIGPDIIQPPANIVDWPGIHPKTVFKDDDAADVGNLLSAISSPIPDNLRKLINNYDEDKGVGIREYTLQSGSRMLFPGNQTNMVQLSLTAASATVNINTP